MKTPQTEEQRKLEAYLASNYPICDDTNMDLIEDCLLEGIHQRIDENWKREQESR